MHHHLPSHLPQVRALSLAASSGSLRLKRREGARSCSMALISAGENLVLAFACLASLPHHLPLNQPSLPCDLTFSCCRIPLSKLRSSMSLIPQVPVLFQGTIRLNLSPFGLHSDAELWNALRRSNLAPAVESWSSGLDTVLAEGGSPLVQARSNSWHSQELSCPKASSLSSMRPRPMST